MGSRSVTCHPTEVNAPGLNPSQIAWYSIYLSCRMEGWVDLGGWLHTEMVYLAKTVTHCIINRARHTLTSLIGSNALPLHHATNPKGDAKVSQTCKNHTQLIQTHWEWPSGIRHWAYDQAIVGSTPSWVAIKWLLLGRVTVFCTGKPPWYMINHPGQLPEQIKYQSAWLGLSIHLCCVADNTV